MDFGKEVLAGVFVELVQEGRWLVRSSLKSSKTSERVGEVMGRPGKYVAFTMKGQRVCVSKTLKGAALKISEEEL